MKKIPTLFKREFKDHKVVKEKENNNFLLDDVFVNIRPMTADKLEGINKDKIESVDNFLSDDSIYGNKEE